MTMFDQLRLDLRNLGALTMLAGAILLVVACAPQPAPPVATSDSSSGAAESAAPDQPEFMFVHIAEDCDVDLEASTVRLVNVAQQVVFFSDRPQRIAGHLTMAEYLEEWTDQEGDDNFGDDPPNATISVFEEGQPDNSVAVIEISKPVVDGSDLIYTFSILEGGIPVLGGPTTLFIDKIGIGGGVGVGYHGVGVGARGPGVR